MAPLLRGCASTELQVVGTTLYRTRLVAAPSGRLRDVSVLGHVVVVVSSLCKDSGVSLQHQVPLYAVQHTYPDKSL